MKRLLAGLVLLAAAAPVHALAPTRVNSTSFQAPEVSPTAVVLDTASGYGYYGFCPGFGGGGVVKVRLSDFTRVGQLLFQGADGCPYSALFDPLRGAAYFGTNASPARIVKVDLAGFTETAAITLNSGEFYPTAAVIDTSAAHAYFGTYAEQIVTVDLTNFTRSGATPAVGNAYVGAAADASNAYFTFTGNINGSNGLGGIARLGLSNGALTTVQFDTHSVVAVLLDSSSAFAYAFLDNGVVSKRSLPDLAYVSSMTLSAGAAATPGAATIDPGSNTGYFSFSDASSGTVVAVDLATLSETGRVSLAAGEPTNQFTLLSTDHATFAHMAVAGGELYLAAKTTPFEAVRIRLSDFTRDATLAVQRNYGPFSAGGIDAAAGYGYFMASGNGGPDRLVKVNLSDLSVAATLDENFGSPQTGMIDGGYGYFASSDSPDPRIAKIRLSDLVWVDTLTVVDGASCGDGIEAIVRGGDGYAYLGLDTCKGGAAKIRLSDFTLVSSASFNTGENSVLSAAIDSVAAYGYFATFTKIVKVRLSDMTRISALLPSVDFEGTRGLTLDSASVYGYATSTNGEGLMKFRLSDMVQISSLTMTGTNQLIGPGATALDGSLFIVDSLASPSLTSRVHEVNLASFSEASTLALNSSEASIMGLAFSTTTGLAYFGNYNIPSEIIAVRLQPQAPVAVAGLSGATLGVSSITWTWSAESGATSYKFYPSTGGAAISLAGTSLTQTKLSTNTAYSCQVTAVNTDLEGPPAAATAWTNAAAPTGPSYGSLSVTGLTINWIDSLNNGVSYLAQISTDDFANVVQSSQTANKQGNFVSLTYDTTYYFRVAALNGAGAPSAYATFTASTLSSVPFNTITPTALSSTSIATAWQSSGNPPDRTLYQVTLSTTGGNDFPAAAADDVSLTTTPTGTTPSATLSGLLPNIRYYQWVKSINNAGHSSGYDDGGAPSVVTFAAVPSTAAALFPAVYASSMSVAWSNSGNPQDVTQYGVALSTDGALAPHGSPGDVLLSTTPTGASPAATVSGLTPNTTYFLWAEAVNLSSVHTGYILLGSTLTPTAAPAGLAADVFVSSLSVTWTSGGNPADTVFIAEVSTDPAYANALPGVRFAGSPAGFAGLFGLTTYYVRVRGYDRDGRYGPAVALSTRTLADTPGSVTLALPSTTTLALGWTAGQNDASAAFRLELATTSDFALRVASAAASAAQSPVTFSGLVPNTTYYGRAITLAGGDGTQDAASPASAPLSTHAVPPVIGALDTPTRQSLTAHWTSADGPSTVYLVEIATKTDFPYDFYLFYSRTNSALMVGLDPYTTYYARVTTLANDGGNQTSAVSAPARTLPPHSQIVEARVAAYTQTTLAYAWTSFLPAHSHYTLRLSSAAFPNASRANLSSTTLNAFASFKKLKADTTYFAELSTDQTSDLTDFPSTATLNVPPAVPTGLAGSHPDTTSIDWSWKPAARADGYEFYLAGRAPVFTNIPSYSAVGLSTNTLYVATVTAVNDGGETKPSARVSYWTLAATPARAGFQSVNKTSMTVTWDANGNPPGTHYRLQYATLGSAAQTFTVIGTTAALGGLKANKAYQVTLSALNGKGVATAIVVLSTQTTLGGGAPGGAALPAAADAGEAKKTAALQPEGSFGTGRVYPNPFRPALGHTGFTFDRFPAATTLAVYSLAGEKVRELTTDGTGKAVWDGTNSSGRALASGLYYVVAASPSGQRTLTLAIQR